MRLLRLWAVVLSCFLGALPLVSQKQRREPLTEAQIESIREAGIDPNERVSIYTKILNEHEQALESLGRRGASNARGFRMSEELQDFTAIMDELGSNLDVYTDRKADIRKALKPLNEDAVRWMGFLRSLSPEPAFDLARKEAIESSQDLAEQAKQLLTEQADYFRQHKDEQGQDRAEPK